MYINKMHFNSKTGGNGTYPIQGGIVPKVGDIIKNKYVIPKNFKKCKNARKSIVRVAIIIKK